MKVLITGGAGFIGSAVCRHVVAELGWSVVNVDKLTYASSLASLAPVSDAPTYSFEQADITDSRAMVRIFAAHQPDAVMHLAAESHVDRSISGPDEFIRTNLIGSFVVLQAALEHWLSLPPGRQERFRYLHVSTDEVYGSLGPEGLFTETSPYSPRSPYSASKAGSDHLARAWFHTYGLPTIVTSCSNNYGPYHFPEKLIPLTILNSLQARELPVYGQGSNVRDWLYVEDHARALALVLSRGEVGSTYNIGGRNERTNLQVVHAVCDLVDELAQRRGSRDLIKFVADRPGHDHRYAIDASKIEAELGWRANESFETGLRKTVQWYLDRRDWWEPLRTRYAGERLGLKTSAAAAHD